MNIFLSDKWRSMRVLMLMVGCGTSRTGRERRKPVLSEDGSEEIRNGDSDGEEVDGVVVVEDDG